MPIKILLLISLCSIYIQSVFPQPPTIEWQKCYGGGGGQICYCIKPTSDGGSISCGTSALGVPGGDISTVYGDHDAWILKLDGTGTIIWEKSIGGSQGKGAYSIQQTTDGGYVVAGYKDTIKNSIIHYDYWIAKLTGGGSIVWEKSYGGTGLDQAYSIQQTTDGGFILAGQTLSSDGDVTGYHGGSGDCWILKLDGQGNLVWQKALGGSTQETAYDVRQTTDGGYIVSAGTSSFDGDVINPSHYVGTVWIIKLDINGNIAWQKVYGSVQGYSICQTTDEGYAFTSNCYNNTNGGMGNHGGEDYWIVRLDAAGNLLWQKTLGGTTDDQPQSIIQSADGGFVVAGRTNSMNGDIIGNHGGLDYWLVKLSSNGELKWTKSLGGIGQESAYSIYQTADLGYIVAGTATSDNNGDVGSNHGGGGDFWIVKLAPDPLPVTLLNFNAIPNGQDIKCTWKTSQEQNSSYFIIERSNDGLHFTGIGRVEAAGNSVLPIIYNFIDQRALLTGTDYLYYRLKTVDLDGSFKNSYVVKVRLGSSSSLNIYPNPTGRLLAINFVSQISEQTQLIIYTDAGMKVFSQPFGIAKGNNTVQSDIYFLPAGSYYLIFGNRIKFQGKFVKVNNY